MTGKLIPDTRGWLVLGCLAIALAGPAKAATYSAPGWSDTLGRNLPQRSVPYGTPDPKDFDNERLKRAWAAFSEGDFDTAAALANSVVSLKPDSAAAWYVLGLSLANLDRLEESLAALDRSSQLFRLNAGPLVVKGDLLLDAGRREEAKAAFTAAAEKDPDDWRAQERLGIMAEEDNDPVEAMRRYELSLAKLPQDRLFPRARLAALYSISGDHGAAVDVLEPFVKANPDNREGLKALARALTRVERYDEAMAKLTAAIDLDPEDIGALLARATVELNTGNFDKAQQTLETAEKLNRRKADVAFVKGRLEMARENPQRAVEYFSEAITLGGNAVVGAPYLARAQIAAGDHEKALQTLQAAAKDEQATAQVWLALGELQAALGDFAAAERAYQSLVKVAPRVAASHFRLGAVRAAQGRYDEALTEFEAGLGIDPGNLPILRGAAVAATRKGDFAAALDYGTRMAEAAGRVVPSLTLLAWIQEQAGKGDAAKATYREILESDPDNIVALNNLAVLLMADGALDEATRLAERARSIDPTASHVWHTSGKISESAGRTDEAVASFEKAAQLAPDNAGYRLDLGIALIKSGARDKGKSEIARSLEMGLPEAKAELARSYLE